jgi:methyl-accepting chemotaxis protein
MIGADQPESLRNPLRARGRLRNKLLSWFLILSLIPLLTVSIIGMVSVRGALQTRAFSQLESLRTTKANQVETYFAEKQHGMNQLTTIVTTLRDETFNKLDAVRTDRQNRIESYFVECQDDVEMLAENLGRGDLSDIDFYAQQFLKRGYENVYLVRPDGYLYYAAQHDLDYQTNLLTGPFKNTPLSRLVKQVLETKQTGLSDLESSLPIGYASAIFIARPILHDGKGVAIVALRLSNDRIAAVMQEQTGLGETYLVGKAQNQASAQEEAIFFLSNSRLITQTTILDAAFAPSQVAARDALRGNTAHAIIPSYRGVPVFASWAPVNILGQNWGIVAEIGVEEAFTPSDGKGEKDSFTRYAEEFRFDDLFLISPADGYVFYSVKHKPDYQTNLFSGPYKNSNLARLVAQVIETKQPGMTDFEGYAPNQNVPAAFIAQPLLNEKGEVDVIVGAQLSLDEIAAITQERTGLGETGEIYLVGPDQLWRSNSRFLNQLGVDHTVLNPTVAVNTIASRNALAGISGTQVIDNYQGRRVLSSWTPVTILDQTPTHPQGFRWALIAEIGENEVNQSLMNTALTGLGLIAIATLLVLYATVKVTRGLTVPIGQVANAAAALASGDLSQRVQVRTGDEVEAMALAFNNMAEQIAGTVGALKQEIAERERIQEALKESEARFRSVVQSASEAIIIADARASIVSWNTGAENVFGYREEEALGQPITLVIPARTQATHREAMKRFDQTGECDAYGQVIERTGRRKDGSEFPIEHSIVSWETQRVKFSAAIIRDITERRKAQTELGRLSEEKGISEERRRIAREIHDGIAQDLASLRLRMDAWKILLEDDSTRLPAELDRAREILATTIREVRRSIFALRPLIIEEAGFFASLQQYVSAFGELHDIRMTLRVLSAHDTLRVPQHLELVLFRIIQEALNNVGKHAHASQVQVTLDIQTNHLVSLLIQDNGVGFDPVKLADVVAHGHVGLAQMRERIENENGSFELHAQPGSGTEIKVKLPWGKS